MHHILTCARPLYLTLLTLTALLTGCDKEPAPGPTAPGGKTAAQDDHDHVEGDDHEHEEGDEHEHEEGDEHEHEEGDEHDHGPVKQLGEKSADGFTIRASRQGDIVEGDDAPVDVSVTGAAKPIATVRFWIGSRDARGSVKAKAELEKDNWHSHVEVPKPLPAGSELWVEVEAEGGKKIAVSFALQN